ncbi:MAG: RAD55 family ATPase [Candidatus Hadarchaeales archaeon]
MILRIPTGFEPLDKVCQGGLPVGAMVVLVGPPGTRKEDFLHSLSVKLAKLNGSKLRENQVLPERVWYLTLTTSKESVLQDVGGKFSEDFCKAFSHKVFFRSFWELPESFVDLARWLKQTDGKVVRDAKSKIFSDLSKFLEREASNSVLIFFPLNDFALFFSEEEKVEFLAFLEELSEACRKWGFTIIAPLIPGTLDPSFEANILSKADGIISFRKEPSPGGRELMVCEKLSGTLLEEVCFEVHSDRRGVELKPLSRSS